MSIFLGWSLSMSPALSNEVFWSSDMPC
jgi:hypothetical protein